MSPCFFSTVLSKFGHGLVLFNSMPFTCNPVTLLPGLIPRAVPFLIGGPSLFIVQGPIVESVRVPLFSKHDCFASLLSFAAFWPISGGALFASLCLFSICLIHNNEPPKIIVAISKMRAAIQARLGCPLTSLSAIDRTASHAIAKRKQHFATK